jgi:uncharacterized membrane protein YccC
VSDSPATAAPASLPSAAPVVAGANSPTRQAVITTLSCYLATLVALATGMENPWWPTLTALLVSNTDPRQLWTRGVLRIGGTGAGCVVGYALALQCADSMLAQMVALFLLSASCIFGMLRSRYPYAWMLFGLTSLLIFLRSLSTTDDLYSYAYFRFLEIVIGVIAVIAVEAVLSRRTFDLGSLHGLVATPPTSSAGEAIPFALTVGIATVLIPLLWEWFQLPAMIPAATLGLFVFDRSIRQLRQHGLLATLGCLIGGVAGLVVLGINADLFIWWSFALVSGIFLLARIQLDNGPYSFVGMFGALTYLMTLITGNGPPQSILTPVNLLFGVVVATAIMSLLLYLIVPRDLRATIARRAT